MGNKKLAILVLLFLIIFCVFVFIRDRSLVQFASSKPGIVTVYDGSSVPSTYDIPEGTTTVFTNPGQKTFVFEAEDGTSKIVNDATSGYMIRKTIDLENTSVQYGRNFLTSNPGNCIALTSSELITYTCGGAFSSVTRHGAPDNSTQTVSLSELSNFSNAVVEGIYEANGRVELLVYNSRFGEVFREVYQLTTTPVSIEAQLISPAVEYGDLPLSSIEKTINGVMLSNEIGEVYSGDSLSNLSKDTRYTNGVQLISSDNTYYTYNREPFSDSTFVPGSTAVQSSMNTSYEANGYVQDLFECGDSIISLEENSTAVLAPTLEFRTRIFSSQAALCFNDELYVVIDGKLSLFREPVGDGFIALSSNSLQVIALGNDQSRLKISIEYLDKTFLIEPIAELNLRPDIDLQPLADSPYVDGFSIKGNSVVVAVDLGELVVNESTGELEYEQVVIDSAIEDIGGIIRDLQNQGKEYTFSVPLLKFYGLEI